MQTRYTRRTLMKTAAVGAGALALGPTAKVLGANDKVRVAFIGLGGRGKGLLGSFSRLENVTVAGLCDADEKNLGGQANKFPENGPEIKHRQNAFFVGIGASYSIPPLKKCPIKRCHSQIDHQHSGIEFRSNRHKFFKKQHPNYGENDPNLIKYKGKNKKKMNPY